MKTYIGLALLLFIFIFQPPFVPVALIYLLGPLVMLLLLRNKDKHSQHRIAVQSEMRRIWYFFLFLGVYLLLINILDIFIVGDNNLGIARLKSFNQLLILPGFQFLFVLYFIILAEKKELNIDDVFLIIVLAACIEGVCAVVAYLSPTMRFLFVTYGQQKLFLNEYFIEKRGFGFAQNLIDTFGFGVGLIAGYILLYDWREKTNRIFLMIAIVLLLFTTAVNARTGLFVFVLAIVVRYLYEKSIVKFVVKLALLLIFGGAIISFAQDLINTGLNSGNNTVVWISSAFDQMMNFFSDDTSQSVEDLTFVSNIVTLPTHPLELLFGSGHWIYDTYMQLGLRTDIGWYNLFWEFGIIGTVVLMTGMTYFIMLPFFLSKKKSIQMISVFNIVAYYIVLVKAILLGSNPGSFVIYFTTFALCYYIRKEKRKPILYDTHA